MAPQKNEALKAELDKRLAMHDAAAELEKVKRDMLKSTAHTDKMGDISIENLSSVGKSEEEFCTQIKTEWSDLLQKIGNYAFSPENMDRYFPGNKCVKLISMMKSVGMEMDSRYVMDVFKNRVKQKNGGKVPTIKEKAGLFGKTVERPMKPEEIVSRFEIEEDIAVDPNNPTPLTTQGTKKGITKHLYTVLIENEDVQDFFKKGPRRTLAKFLQAAKLLNSSTTHPTEKLFVAALLTPDSIQPKSMSDKENLDKFRKVLLKAHKWIDRKLASASEPTNGKPDETPETSNEAEQEPSAK